MSWHSSRGSFSSGHPRLKPSHASMDSLNSITFPPGSYGDVHADSNLGNLADELAEAADVEADEQLEAGPLSPSFLQDLREGDQDDSVLSEPLASPLPYDSDGNDRISRMALEPPRHRHHHSYSDINTTPTTPTSKRTRGRRSKSTSATTNTTNTTGAAGLAAQSGDMPSYDGSDYGPGSESEGELTGSPMRPLLGKRMRSIERLVHHYSDYGDVEEALANGDSKHQCGSSSSSSSSSGVIPRLTQSLRDLGPTQANVEYGVTRLLTACNSIATHRTHAQRHLFSASHSLMYGHRIYSLPSSTLDELASELDHTSETLPVPPTTNPPHQNPLVSLSILVNDTKSLINSLRSLTDLLQETRQATNAASRKLKTVRDMVEELREDEESVENSMVLIQAGDWDRRCRERQAARVCKEVVQGFGDRWDIDVPATATATATAATTAAA